jgi:putative ABC transport system substrate-binding protein
VHTPHKAISGTIRTLGATVLAIMTGWTASFAHADTPSPATTPPRTLAVIYSYADEATPGAFAELVAGIESNADVAVLRVQLLATDMVRAQLPPPAQIMLASAGTTSIAVIYPDIGEPYQSVFAKIIEGIEHRTDTRVAAYAVRTDANTQALAEQLRRQNIKVVIALGRHGLRVAGDLDRSIGVVAGGVISAPDSLAPDPERLFAQLRELMPAARRVFVVYDPGHNAWLIRLAREAAKLHGLELVTHEARDLRTAVRHYQDILRTADPRFDALWLPQDTTTVDDSSVLPLVLERSWDRSLAVFSSNVAHARRGVLFALYPNNVELGRNLAASAMNYLASGSHEPRGVTPLRDVLVAVNLRTASHLGLRLSYAQQRRFDLVFPQP